MQSEYAEKADLISLSVTPEVATQWSDSAIKLQLQAASSLADVYLRSQFELPLIEWDMSLTKIVCDIAAAGLLEQYGYNPNAVADGIILKRREDAMKYLRMISEQNINPDFTDSSTGSPEAGPFVLSNSQIGWALFNNGTETK